MAKASYEQCPAAYGQLCCTRGLGHEGLHMAPDGSGVPVTWKQKVSNSDVRPQARSWWGIVSLRKDCVEEEEEKLQRDVEALRAQAAAFGAFPAQFDALARSLGVLPAVFRGDPNFASSQPRAYDRGAAFRQEAVRQRLAELANAPPPGPKNAHAKKTPEPAADQPARRITLED